MWIEKSTPRISDHDGQIFSIHTKQPWKNLRIFQGRVVRIEKSVWGSRFSTTRLCWVMPNSDPDGHQTTMTFFFLHTFWSPVFDFTLMSHVPIIDVRHVESWCRMWHRNDVNSQRLNDRVTWPPIRPKYWQHMLFVFYLSDKGCNTRFISTRENRGKLCPGCKNLIFRQITWVWIFFTLIIPRVSLPLGGKLLIDVLISTK